MSEPTSVDRLMRFDRADSRLTLGLIVVIAVATPLFTLVLPVIDWVRGRPLHVPLMLMQEERIGAPADGVTISSTGEAVATFAHAGADLWLVSLVPGLLVVLALWGVLWVLAVIVRSVRDESPFTLANVRRMRALALILMLGPVVYGLAVMMVNGFVLERALADFSGGALASFGPSGILLIGAGLVVACLAEVFLRGLRLEKDVEGLI